MLKQGTCPAQMMKRTSIVAAIEQAGLPVFEPVVAFQQRFGGRTFRVRGCRGINVLDLFQPEIDGFTPDGQHYYFRCFTHGTAQLGFYLDQDGTMYVDECFPAPIAIASSIEKYLESEALVNELIDLSFKWWTPLGQVAQDDTRLREHLDLPIIASASDAYTTCWGNNRIRVEQGVFWSKGLPQHHRVLYARTKADAQEFIDSLWNVLDLSKPSWPFYPWP